MREWRAAIRTRIGALGLPPGREAEIVEELTQYLEDRHRGWLAEGLSEAEARQRVLDELDAGEALTRALGEIEGRAGADIATPGMPAPGRRPFAGLWQDVRDGWRAVRTNAGLSAVAVLILALGIGANTAMFQLLNVVTLRALPVRDPASLVEIRIDDFSKATGNFMGRHPRLNYPVWQQLRQVRQSFDGLFVWGTAPLDLSTGGEAHYANGLWVSGDFFQVLGLRPSAGRLLTAADDQPGCGSPAVVLSDAFWKREYGGDPAVVGRAIRLSDRPFEIVGVAPPGFFGVEVGWQFDVAAPVCAQAIVRGDRDSFEKSYYWWLGAMARLKPGVSAEQATAELREASPAIFRATVPAIYQPEEARNYANFLLGAFPGSTGISQLRRTFETPLWLLVAMTGSVLLVACANLANLLLARANGRQREVAIRLALGASRARLVRQLLLENLWLAAAGTVAAMFVARTLSRVLVAFLDTDANPLFLDLRLDWRMLAFTAGLGLLTCALFGILPALRTTAMAPGAVFKTQGRGLTAGRERVGLRRALVVVQVALSLALVVGAALFVRTFRNLMTVDTGFRRAGVLVANLRLDALATPAAGRPALHRDILERLRAIPGVAAVGEVAVVQGLDTYWNDRVVIDGDAAKTGPTNVNAVSPGYLQALGIPLVAGRDFAPFDSSSTAKVAIVSEAFVAKYLPGGTALGRIFRFEAGPGEQQPAYEVVGVMKDTKYLSVRDGFGPLVYLDALQEREPSVAMTTVLRSDLPASAVASAVKAVLAARSPRISVTFQALDRQIGESISLERLMAALSGFFGILAALIATVGLYAVIAYSVARRRNEIGIRMALGADRRRVVAMVLREAALLLLAGLAAGAVLALAGGHAARTLLFGLSPSDPMTFASATLGLAAVVMAASYVPARRAARLEPMAALHED